MDEKSIFTRTLTHTRTLPTRYTPAFTRPLHSTIRTMAPNDPYTAKAQDDASPQEKIAELKNIIKETKFGMLVTRSADGQLHSRAMAPASHKGLVFQFIANTDSGKFDELDNDGNVNVSFADPSSTDWASVAGKASIVKDESTVKDLWNPTIKSWFGDLKDGVRTGEPGDPRIAVIQVIPTEWVKTRTSLGQTVEVLKGAVTGETAAPGHLRVIAGSDLELVLSMGRKEWKATSSEESCERACEDGATCCVPVSCTTKAIFIGWQDACFPLKGRDVRLTRTHALPPDLHRNSSDDQARLPSFQVLPLRSCKSLDTNSKRRRAHYSRSSLGGIYHTLFFDHPPRSAISWVPARHIALRDHSSSPSMTSSISAGPLPSLSPAPRPTTSNTGTSVLKGMGTQAELRLAGVIGRGLF
ncbi:Protein bli-3 [Rhodotorula toruloides]|nr:Protein bli-3 [Rhodotorula toruloides]